MARGYPPLRQARGRDACGETILCASLELRALLAQWGTAAERRATGHDPRVGGMANGGRWWPMIDELVPLRCISAHVGPFEWPHGVGIALVARFLGWS